MMKGTKRADMTSDELKVLSDTQTHLDDDETERHGNDRPHHHAAHLRKRITARYNCEQLWSKRVRQRTQNTT